MKRKPSIENLRLAIQLIDNPTTMEIGIYTFIHNLAQFNKDLYISTSFSLEQDGTCTVYSRPDVETASGQTVLTWQIDTESGDGHKRIKSPRTEIFFREAARNITGQIEAALAQKEAAARERQHTEWVQEQLRLAEERKLENEL